MAARKTGHHYEFTEAAGCGDRQAVKSSPKLIIVGGGASGLIAGIAAARRGLQVTILEKNSTPGKKLLATGNGRCNLTNRHLDIKKYLRTDAIADISSDKEIASVVQSVIRAFSVRDTEAFFESLGLMLIDRDGWVYPRSEQATAVLSVLQLEAERLGIRMKTNATVQSVKAIQSRYTVSTDSWSYEADAVIIACGSPASNVSGACEDALKFAKELHIPAYEFHPCLTGLRVGNPVAQKWEGVRVKAAVALYVDQQELQSEVGELQLANQGVSGIPIFQLSHRASTALAKNQDVRLRIDLFPELSEEELQQELVRRAQEHSERTIMQNLIGMLPEKLLKAYKFPDDISMSDLAHRLKNTELTVTGTGSLKQAQVCYGGISLDAVTDNLESRKYKNLFFAGEALDVDGPCGGYNLQWAWSSGYIAACAAAEALV